MAGLLDIFDTDEGRLGLGLLMAAGPRADGAGFGQRVGDAFSFVERGRTEKEDRAQKQAMQQMQMAEIQARAQEYQSKTAKEKAAAERAVAFQSALTQNPGAFAQLATQFPDQVDLIEKLSKASTFGKPRVSRTAEVSGPNGSKQIIQLDDFGQPVGDAMHGYVAPQLVNLGNKQVFQTPQAGASFDVGMSPSEQDASRRGWANNSLAQQRFAMDQKQAQEGGKPTFNADAGGFIYPPSATNPSGNVVKVPGFSKPLNDVQGKALLFGTRMAESDKVINNLSKSGIDVSMPLSNAGFGIGSAVNLVNSEQGQMLDQAKRDFLNAVLRRESGAVISPEEFDSANKQYFPQIGDGNRVKEQKAKNRVLATRGILSEVPDGATKISPEKSSEQPATQGKFIDTLPKTGPVGQRVRDTQTGKIMRFDGMRWKEE